MYFFMLKQTQFYCFTWVAKCWRRRAYWQPGICGIDVGSLSLSERSHAVWLWIISLLSTSPQYFQPAGLSHMLRDHCFENRKQFCVFLLVTVVTGWLQACIFQLWCTVCRKSMHIFSCQQIKYYNKIIYMEGTILPLHLRHLFSTSGA